MREMIGRFGNFMQFMVSISLFVFTGLNLIFECVDFIGYSFFEMEIAKLIVVVLLCALLSLFSVISSSAENDKLVKINSCFSAISVMCILYFFDFNVAIYFLIPAIVFAIFDLINGIVFISKY